MPNIYPFFKRPFWGELLTIVTIASLLGGMVWGSVTFVGAQSSKATSIEQGIQGLLEDMEEIKEDYVPRPEIDASNLLREKRFEEGKKAIEKSIEALKEQQAQHRDEQREFQMEQRAVNREILKALNSND